MSNSTKDHSDLSAGGMSSTGRQAGGGVASSGVSGKRRYVLESRKFSGKKGFNVSRKDLEASVEAWQTPSASKHKWFNLGHILLLVVCVGIVAGIEQAIRQSGESIPSGKEAVIKRGDAVPVLGASARRLPGLQEVTPAYLPYLEDLPAGTVDCVQRQLDESGRRGLPVEVVNSVGMHFRLIPAGDCMIGSPAGESGHSMVESQHKASFLEPFYLGSTEVTQAQWEAVMGKGNNPSHFRGADLPVEEVSWGECMEFVKRLNELEGLPKHTYRLPLEMEWEYACRAGSATAYCFGDDVSRLNDFADYEGNSRRTGTVGRKRPNALGLFDMHGNVWEWCRDLYSNYPGDSTAYSKAHTYRCIRGGNWYVKDFQCRSANRARLPDRSKGNMLGFRVMRIISETP